MSREEEEDDLESLRIAALKSRAHKDKRELINGPVTNEGYAIKVLEGPISRGNLSASRNIKSFDAFTTNRRLEQLDLNEPYVPQSVCRNENWEAGMEFVSYIPSRPISNVQLSPRSLAFVAQNNDILMRRKGEKSPITYRSPSPYRETVSRWSVSPPAGNSPTWRSPNFRNSRRSISRTPSPKRFIKSPKRLVSRSPNRIHRSPGRSLRITGNRRSQSRSPIHKRISRSPINYSRRISPNTRAPYQNKRRSFSPSQKIHNSRKRLSPISQKNNVKTIHQDHSPSKIRSRFSKSPSPINSHKLNERKSQSPAHRIQRKRSRSPFFSDKNNQNLPLLKRSKSRSPNKRRRRSRDNMLGRRVSPSSRNNHNFKNDYRKSNRNNSSKNNKIQPSKSQRSNYRNRSSQSPKVNKTNSLSQQSKENLKISLEDGNKQNVSSDEHNINNQKILKQNNRIKTEQEIEDELLASSDDEKNSGDDNDEDEIDLFASEESESENEGRFKSSNNKNEKSKTSTVSFSKLVGSTTTAIAELKDIGSSGKNDRSSNSRDYTRRNNRDSNRKYNRGSRNDNWKDRNISLSRSDTKKKSEKSSTNSMKMFKPTFQAVEENEPKSKILISSDNSLIIEEKTSSKEIKVPEETTEKRNTLQLKRVSKEEPKNGVEKLLPDSTTATTSSGTEISSTMKKPIHLRLGAITGKTGTSTWKNKKSWRIEKV